MLMMTQAHMDLMQDGIIAHQCQGEGLIPGDMIRTGENLHPHYHLVAVNGDTAWVRNIDTGAQALTALNRCRRIRNLAAQLPR